MFRPRSWRRRFRRDAAAVRVRVRPRYLNPRSRCPVRDSRPTCLAPHFRLGPPRPPPIPRAPRRGSSARMSTRGLRVAGGETAVTVGMVFGFGGDDRARLPGAAAERIDVVDLDMNLHRRATTTAGPAVVRAGITHHDHRPAQSHLGVTDISGGIVVAQRLLEPERLSQERQRGLDVLVQQVRRRGVHWELPSGAVPSAA